MTNPRTAPRYAEAAAALYKGAHSNNMILWYQNGRELPMLVRYLSIEDIRKTARKLISRKDIYDVRVYTAAGTNYRWHQITGWRVIE